jgi:DNA-binding beta-propeller fold protein YncE
MYTCRNAILFLLTTFLVNVMTVSSGQDLYREIIHTIPAPGKSLGITWDEEYIWVSDDLNRQYHKLDPENGTILTSIDYHETVLYSQGMAFDGTYLWTNGWEDPSGSGSKIFKIDTTTLEIISIVDYPRGYYDNWPHGMTYAGSHLWVTNLKTNTLDKIDPNSGELIGTLSPPADSPIGIAWHANLLWTNDYQTGLIYVQDPQTGNVIGSIAAPGTNCRGMEWDNQYLWTVSFEMETIYQLDIGDLGLKDVRSNIYSLYPNPARDYINVSFPPEYHGPAEINLFDLSGKSLGTVVYRLTPGQQEFRIYLDFTGSGIFLARIKTENATETLRFIIIE